MRSGSWFAAGGEGRRMRGPRNLLRAPAAACALLVTSLADIGRAEPQPRSQPPQPAAPEASSTPRDPAPSPAPAVPGKSLPPSRKALAVGAAIVPGVLVHGSGHFVAGNTSTAYSLLAMEGLGVGLAGGSLAILAATGASRRFVGPLIATTVTGAGLLLVSVLADLYGVIAPEEGWGSPPRRVPWVETQVGFRYVYDPTFSYRTFLTQSVDVRLGDFRLMPSGWFALDDANARVRMLGAYRIKGPRPGDSADARDGSFLDAETAVTHHRYGSDGFSITTWEASLNGRLDMDRLFPSLRGSFAEAGWGAAVEAYRYFELTTEGNTILLARFGYGVYLGRAPDPSGEVMFYYDHRHDDFAAGLKMFGLGSGVAGHFGLRGVLYLDDTWGALFDAQVGSAYLGGISLLYRHGASP